MALAFQHGRAFSVKMGIVQFFVLSCCLLQLWNPIICCGIFEVSYGSVTEDQEIQIGSNFTSQCTLFKKITEEHGVTSADIVLKLGRDVLVNTRIVDKYTVEYTVQNATVNHTGMYNCFVQLPDKLDPQLVCGSYIAVGYKPEDVQVHDFSCISDEYTNLTCTWTPPFNPIPTTWKLYDFFHNNIQFHRLCPVPSKSGCQFRVDTKPPYIQDSENLYFYLEIRNSLGVYRQTFIIRHSEIIRPGVPSAVTERVSKTSLVLRLSAPRGMQNGEFPNGLLYSVKYYSISTKLNITKVAEISAETNALLKIEDLVPHTLYKFEIRCRLNISLKNFYWSGTFVTNEMTESDVPYKAPVIDNSSFDIQVIAGKRTISIYWKGVPSEFQNGAGFRYEIRYRELNVQTRFARQTSRKPSLSVWVDNMTSHSFENMDTDKAYEFTIIAANDVGKSSNETAVIVVDKTENLLQGPKDITVINLGQGNYEMSYKAPDVNSPNFMVFTCETMNSRPANCKGRLDWMFIGNKTYLKLSLQNNSTNYQFGVAAVQDGKTSGITWASCIVLYGVPYNVKDLELVPKTSTSLKVSWSLQCEAERKVYKEHALHVCPYNGTCISENARKCKVNGLGVSEWTYVIITNTSENEYILENREPFTCYYVYMRSRTDGGWSENSKIAHEITMASAPSDPPANVHAIAIAQESKAASIQVSFDPPSIPNGVISRYKVYYNKTSSEGLTYHKEIRIQDIHNVVTLDNVFYYSNYSIEVTACVDQACSIKSEPIYVYTGISYPGVLNQPRLELMDDFLNITWEAPLFPNGPAEFYQVKMINNDSNIDQLFNVTHQKFFTLNRDCTTEGIVNAVYDFKVRAVNFRDGIPLFGDYSGPAKMMICPKGSKGLWQIVLILSFFFAGVISLVVISCIVRKCTRKVMEVKNTAIKLPKGLESPLDPNPLSSYDKFKSGLHNSRDSGIPNDRAYDRLCSSASEGDLKIADELAKRGPSGRNPSGESSVSGKGHDSISSANTTKTHNSMDSGAEVESPPSPDSFSSDSVSMNTTPRAFKSDLGRVNEVNHFGSKDSGLAKDDTRPINSHTNLALSSRGRCFETSTCNGQSNPYSKLDVKGSFCRHGSANYSPLHSYRTLSRSESSVADSVVGDGRQPLVNSSMQSYSKIGFASSAGNGLNFPPANSDYSKFSVTYRPQKTNSKIQPQDSQVFSVITVYDRSGTGIPSLKKKEEPSSPTAFGDLKKPGKEQLGSAYSKFGVVEPIVQAKAYISVADFSAKPSPSHRADARKQNIADTSQEDLVARSDTSPEGVVNKAANVSLDHEGHADSQGETSGNKPTRDEDCKTILAEPANEYNDNHVLSQVATVNCGYSPLPLTSCPTVQKPDAASKCNDIAPDIDLLKVLPPNFVIRNNDPNDGLCSTGTDNTKCFANGSELDIPLDTEFSSKFFAGGHVFLSGEISKDDTKQNKGSTDFWCELGPIHSDPDACCNGSDNEPPREHSTSNGYAQFSQLTNDANISAHVISRPNLANVPVESV